MNELLAAVVSHIAWKLTTPKYVVVNLDKHQDDVLICDVLSPNVINDADACLTVIVDLDTRKVYLGKQWTDVRVKAAPDA